MTTHAIILTILLLYHAHQIATIWHFNNGVPSSRALRSSYKSLLSLSHFCTLSLSTSWLHPERSFIRFWLKLWHPCVHIVAQSIGLNLVCVCAHYTPFRSKWVYLSGTAEYLAAPIHHPFSTLLLQDKKRRGKMLEDELQVGSNTL